jgi:hypothetical protein
MINLNERAPSGTKSYEEDNFFITFSIGKWASFGTERYLRITVLVTLYEPGAKNSAFTAAKDKLAQLAKDLTDVLMKRGEVAILIPMTKSREEIPELNTVQCQSIYKIESIIV